MKWIPKVFSLAFLWGAIFFIIIFLDPDLIRDIVLPNSYLPFYTMFTLAIWYSTALIVRSFFYSLLLTITIISGLVLSMIGVMHWGLALALLLTLVMESWYIYHRHEKINATDEQKN